MNDRQGHHYTYRLRRVGAVKPGPIGPPSQQQLRANQDVEITGAASKRGHVRKASLERSRSHKNQNCNNHGANEVGNNPKSLVPERSTQNQLEEDSNQGPQQKCSNAGQAWVVDFGVRAVPPGARKNSDGDNRGKK